MKVTYTSNNAGHGMSTLTYEGTFVKAWTAACFLHDQLNGDYDEPSYSIETWADLIKKHTLPWSFDALECCGGGSMPDYANIKVCIE